VLEAVKRFGPVRGEWDGAEQWRELSKKSGNKVPDTWQDRDNISAFLGRSLS
jgi:hypothetical protein